MQVQKYKKECVSFALIRAGKFPAARNAVFGVAPRPSDEYPKCYAQDKLPFPAHLPLSPIRKHKIHPSMKISLSLVLRVVVAAILLQTLFFKFSAAPESVWIFQTLGLEPWGRIASGVVELVAALLILWPRTTGLGALLALGVISGAILSHLTKLGIEVQGDGGLLLGLAIIVFIGSAVLAWLHRREIPVVGQWFA